MTTTNCAGDGLCIPDLPAPTAKRETSAEPWFHCGPHDVFPEQWLALSRDSAALRDVFLKHHADLLTAACGGRSRRTRRTPIIRSADSACCTGGLIIGRINSATETDRRVRPGSPALARSHGEMVLPISARQRQTRISPLAGHCHGEPRTTAIDSRRGGMPAHFQDAPPVPPAADTCSDPRTLRPLTAQRQHARGHP